MKFKCFIGVHEYEDIKTQISKHMCFGFGEGLPGYRVTQRCKHCSKERYISLNLFTPEELLYNDNVWK